MELSLFSILHSSLPPAPIYEKKCIIKLFPNAPGKTAYSQEKIWNQ